MDLEKGEGEDVDDRWFEKRVIADGRDGVGHPTGSEVTMKETTVWGGQKKSEPGVQQWSFIVSFLFLCCSGAALSFHSFIHSFNPIHSSHHTDSFRCIYPSPIVHRPLSIIHCPSGRLPTHYAHTAFTPTDFTSYFVAAAFYLLAYFLFSVVRRTKNTSSCTTIPQWYPDKCCSSP